MEPWPLGWGSLGCTTLPCTSQIFGLVQVPPHCQTCPSKSRHDGAGIGTAYSKGITALPEPGCCLQPD